MTSSRITILLDDDIVKKLRAIQANQIKQSPKSISFSKVVNEELRKSLRKS